MKPCAEWNCHHQVSGDSKTKQNKRTPSNIQVRPAEFNLLAFSGIRGLHWSIKCIWDGSWQFFQAMVDILSVGEKRGKARVGVRKQKEVGENGSASWTFLQVSMQVSPEDLWKSGFSHCASTAPFPSHPWLLYKVENLHWGRQRHLNEHPASVRASGCSRAGEEMKNKG